MVIIKQNLCPQSKWAIKCPYEMKTPKYIVIHNTANDASAENEVAYMIRNNNEVSFHYAADHQQIVQGILLNRNTWHCGDGGEGQGNRYGISIEICYSKSGGTKFEQAQRNAAELAAKLLKDYNLPISALKKHQDFNKKHCPHRTLDQYGWDFFVNLVEEFLNPKKPSNTLATGDAVQLDKDPVYTSASASKPSSYKTGTYYVWDAKQTNGRIKITNTKERVGKAGQVTGWVNISDVKEAPSIIPTPAPAPAPEKKIDVTYQVWDDVRNIWLPNVKNVTDYAGLFGHDVCAVYANLSSGNITYQVHTKGGKWLGEIKNRSDYAGIYNLPIDAIRMKTDTGKTIHYQVHLRKKNKWLGWVTGYNINDSKNGYAGILGQEIDAIRIYVD